MSSKNPSKTLKYAFTLHDDKGEVIYYGEEINSDGSVRLPLADILKTAKRGESTIPRTEMH